MTFLLLRTEDRTGMISVVPQPPASQVTYPHPQPGVFSMGPVEGEEGGDYACLYQVTYKRGLVNSPVSNEVLIVVKVENKDLPSLLLL